MSKRFLSIGYNSQIEAIKVLQKQYEAFIKKGIEESKKGKICVFLIPVSTSTKLFHEYIKPNATEFVKGRIKFGERDENRNFFLNLSKNIF